MGSSIPDLPNDSPIKQSAGRSTGAKQRIWIRLFRWLMAISVFVAILVTINRSADQFADLDFDVGSINYLLIGLSVLSYLTAMLFSCLFWRASLVALGCKPDWPNTMYAFFASQLGKYVPGKAMVVIIRTDLIRGENIKTVAAAASVFVETLTWIFVGSVLACALIIVQFPDQQALKWTALSLALVAGCFTFPPIFRTIATRLTRQSADVFSGLDLKTMSFGWGIMSIGWCFNALSLYLVVASLPGTNICWGDFSLTLACVSLATVAGFASLLPGGLGVRELVMLPLLGPRFGIATALIAAVLIRLVWISAELLSSGIIYLMLRSSGKP